MADQQTTAAPAANPAEVSKTESTANVQSESKTETSDSKPEEKANKTGNGEEKWEVNGKSEDKNGRRNDRRDGGRGGRGSRGGRGNFRDNRNKRCAQSYESASFSVNLCAGRTTKNLTIFPSPTTPTRSAPKYDSRFPLHGTPY